MGHGGVNMGSLIRCRRHAAACLGHHPASVPGSEGMGRLHTHTHEKTGALKCQQTWSLTMAITMSFIATALTWAWGGGQTGLWAPWAPPQRSQGCPARRPYAPGCACGRQRRRAGCCEPAQDAQARGV
eukprot:1160786-Pelagomonas_calceolata.AAC.5